MIRATLIRRARHILRLATIIVSTAVMAVVWTGFFACFVRTGGLRCRLPSWSAGVHHRTVGLLWQQHGFGAYVDAWPTPYDGSSRDLDLYTQPATSDPLLLLTFREGGFIDSGLPFVRWRGIGSTVVYVAWVPSLPATALIPTVFVVRRFARRRLRIDGAGQPCPNCGYDVRASVDRCPECGRPFVIV